MPCSSGSLKLRAYDNRLIILMRINIHKKGFFRLSLYMRVVADKVLINYKKTQTKALMKHKKELCTDDL